MFKLTLKPFAIALFLITVFVVANFSSCKDPVSPYDQLKPGRRDYVWDVDTLDIPFTSLWRIWGSDPNNVWAVGPGGDLDKTIYYFDGEKWNNDGVSRNVSPLSIWGFAKNDVWIAGYDGQIWHFNGADWSESKRFERPPENGIGFIDIWGETQNNLYAVGTSGYEENRKAVMAKYDGKNWELIDFSELKRHGFMRIRRQNTDSKKYYLYGINEQPLIGDLSCIFEYEEGKEINKIYERKESLKTGGWIQQIDNEMYFVIGNTINKYVNNSFKKVFEVTLPNFGIQIHGRNAKDIFLRMTDGIAHYNGNDIKYLYNFEGRVSFSDAIVFEKEIFVLATDITNGFDLVFRGKLK